jgi:uncharacterized protein YcbX
MAGEPLAAADVSWNGLAGDRRWGFALDDTAGSGFPWLTARRLPALVRYRPRLVTRDRPDGSPVVVTTPSGAELAVEDPALAAELAASQPARHGAVRALKLDRGAFDSAPLSLVTTRALAGLATLVGRPVEVARLRPNILVEPAGGTDPFPEDGWVGATLAVGGAAVRVDRRDRRCVVVGVDPATGVRAPGVLRAIARHRDGQLGTYATPVAPGPVRVGDPVVVVTPPAGQSTMSGEAPSTAAARSSTISATLP